ncbi:MULTISPECIES: GNAT family N-acetyltransferase [unclassified Spirosoma]|uniref:GNAT family N-acetyltransferase n=1 Tax=unclassified Spirosoma TaxID=2621999 RepID=UPI0009604359|nr:MULTISPECIES: GNAT family N-acetyltransferase [unclassified Spirosoma]MBN8824962.1 GNAT family N-acetyltransferase [Spirosoma sp.]OJW74721.1 MAG: GNAT family N-acetyltransferase [Spirosoma sp. 48-14]
MFETDRLLLQEFTFEDAPFILELLNTPAWLRFIGDRGVRTLDDARQYILNGPLHSYEQHGFGPYLVRLKEDGLPIGMCGLFKRDTLEDMDIGFAYLPEHIGKGYGLEAAATVMNFARDGLKATRIVGVVDPQNANSIRLLEKLGMHFVQAIRLNGHDEESWLFASGK